MSATTFDRLRVAIVGSCQVAGLAVAARDLLPGATVKSWHVGANPMDSDHDILAQLPTYDVVVSQLSDLNTHVELRISRLRERKLPVFYLPILAFTGFHPDIAYIRDGTGVLHGAESDYHSIIVAASFVSGLPEPRAAQLFNTFVFSQLGYFEVFDAARKSVVETFRRESIDVEPMMQSWMASVGQFMHTINHPHIVALASLGRLALSRAGLVAEDAPFRGALYDYLATRFIWPTYPPLAKRIGIAGSMTFLRRTHGLPTGERREQALVDFVAAAYRRYQDVPVGALRQGVVEKAAERIAGFVS